MKCEPLIVERYEGPADDQEVLRLKGPLTTENLSPFQNAMRGEFARTMILDLTHVPYIDSAGLGSLVAAYVSYNKAGRRVALAGANERVQKLFEITHIEPFFLSFPTLETAIEALTTAGEA
jgi:anti-sigma B factor antagonist